MTAWYRSILKMRVTLTLMPRAMDVVIAASPQPGAVAPGCG